MFGRPRCFREVIGAEKKGAKIKAAFWKVPEKRPRTKDDDEKDWEEAIPKAVKPDRAACQNVDCLPSL
jgi:hypothetical protein